MCFREYLQLLEFKKLRSNMTQLNFAAKGHGAWKKITNIFLPNGGEQMVIYYGRIRNKMTN